MSLNDNVDGLIQNFSDHIRLFNENNPFSGPSEYFYINKIIHTTKKGDYQSVFTKEFNEWLYATLASWGMHRMGPDNKGAKMNDFKSFNQCILQNKEAILELKDLQISSIDVDEVLKELKPLYLSFWPLMKSNSKLVATSKIMHFLLPHLIPPMDREYTMKFFGQNLPTITSIEDKKNIQRELDIFTLVFDKMAYISKQVDCTVFINEEFSPTVPKVIDNAIVNYVITKKKGL